MTFLPKKTLKEKILYDPIKTVMSVVILVIIVLMITGYIPVTITCGGGSC